MPNDDLILLQEYARTGSETAFTTLVERHIAMVHSVAWRQTSDPHLAEEVSQAVFIILARKAGSLGPKTILSGWLCRTARYASANALTIQRRRQCRESEAHRQSFVNEPESEAEAWRHIAPLLDGALEQLGPKDHDAVVLRFFERRDFKGVGSVLGASEDAAKMRVSRALDKLRKILAKRGVRSSTAIIAGVISAHSVQAAPAGLAKTVSVTAITKGTAASALTLTIPSGALKLMAWTKTKTAMAVGLGILLTTGGSLLTLKAIQHYRMYAWRTHGITRADTEKLDQWPAQVWIAPAKNVREGNQLAKSPTGKLMGRNVPFPWLLRDAYGLNTTFRIILPPEPLEGAYDFMATQPAGAAEALQREISKSFKVTVKRESISTNVLLLTVGSSGVRGFDSPTANARATLHAGTDKLTWLNQPILTLDVFLEQYFKTPLIDQTGIVGNHDFALQWDEQWWFNHRDDPEGLRPIILKQLGLELVSTNLPVEMMVVEKTR